MIALKYALFALVAILCNLAVQRLSLGLYGGPLALYLAMGAGTGAGLVTKYLLDKNQIFYHASQTARQETATFFLYAFTGIFTTLWFWGLELAFHHLWGVPAAKYVGGALGLGTGYLGKYFLDKKWVFTERT